MEPTRPTQTLVANDVASLVCFDREYRSRVWAIAFRMTRDEWMQKKLFKTCSGRYTARQTPSEAIRTCGTGSVV
jgi:hypothetical protein